MKKFAVITFALVSSIMLMANDGWIEETTQDLVFIETIVTETDTLYGSSYLTNSYLNRAETYIVSEKFEEALLDIEKGYAFAQESKQLQAEQRALLDMVIACAFLGKDEMALTSMNKLERLFLSSENLCNRNKNIH